MPLFTGSSLYAALILVHRQPGDGFSSAALDFCRRLSAALSLALDNVRLLESEQRARHAAREQLAITESLLNIAEILSGLSKIDDMIEAIATFVSANMGCRTGFAIADEDGRVVRLDTPSMHAIPPGEMPTVMPDHVARLFECDCVRVMEVDVTTPEARLSDSVLVAPLVLEKGLRGVLTIVPSTSHRDFPRHDLELVEGLAAIASSSFERSLLFERQARSGELNEALALLDAIIHSAAPMPDVIDSILRITASILDCDRVRLVQREGMDWIVTSAFGESASSVGDLLPAVLHPLLDEMFAMDRPLVLSDVAGRAEYEGQGIEVLLAATSMGAPLIVKARPFGALLMDRDDGRPFSAEEQLFARKLASALSLSLDNARLIEGERSAARLAAALNRINELLLSTLDAETVMESVVMEAARAAGAHSGFFLVPVNNGFRVRYGYNVSGLDGRVLAQEAARDVAYTVESGQPMLVENAATHACAGAWTKGADVGSYMLVPVMSNEDVAGVLGFSYRSTVRFRPRDLEFADRLGAALSLALRNAERYEEQHRIADTLQEALLALPRSLPGVAIAHHYHSATESARVGGDFYDVFQIDAEKVGVLVGDVSGKGLEAAILTSLVRNAVRAHAMDGTQPDDVVRKLNELVYSTSPPETFVTVFFGVLDRRRATLTYTNAGHPPGLFRDAAGSLRLLVSNSPFVGAFPNVTFHRSTALIGENDVLFLYTDGVVEARDSLGSMLGERHLIDTVGSVEPGDAHALVGRVRDALLDFTDGHLRDDVALLALGVERLASGAVYQPHLFSD